MPFPLRQTEARQQKRNKDVVSDVCLGRSCCPWAGADIYRVAQEPNRNRKPEPSEPFFLKPKAEPEPPEPFSRNRNRNRNRPFLLNSTETQKNLFYRGTAGTKTGTARTVPSPNRNRTEPNRIYERRNAKKKADPGKSRKSILGIPNGHFGMIFLGLSGSHRSTHIASDLASRVLISQAKPQRESESQAFRIARS